MLTENIHDKTSTVTFYTLRAANENRQAEWDPQGFASNPDWRLNELAGEAGEVCNVLKKLHREQCGVPGSRSTKEALAEELADVVICLDLAAMQAGRGDVYDPDSRPTGLYKDRTLPWLGRALMIHIGGLCADNDGVMSAAKAMMTVEFIAHRERIDLRKAIQDKFNATSEKVGLRTRLSL